MATAVNISASPLRRLVTNERSGGLACALLVLLAFIVSHPTLEMGTSDDWSYARTSLDLLRTGHFKYNGWATAMLGWQVYWGALFIKILGYSFFALRVSTLLFAMASAWIFHNLCLSFGLNSGNAFLAAATLVLSPVFLPLSASFMTDVPGVFWLLFCLWSCLKALNASITAGAVAWLCVASLSGIVGGTGRQIVWLGALMMVPSTAWLLRRSKAVLVSAALFWLVTLSSTLISLAWFDHQPFAIPESIPVPKFTIELVLHVLQQFRDIFLSVLLLTLPAIAAFSLHLRKLPRTMVVVATTIVLLISVARLHSHGVNSLAPWLPNFFTEYGVGGDGTWENLGVKPIILPPFVRLFLTLLLALSTASIIVSVVRVPARLSETRPSIPVRFIASWRTIFFLLVPFSLAYLSLLFPRAAFGIAVDRYLLPLVAIVLIPLLRFYQERISFYTPVLSFSLLAIFSAYSIAATHDYFATGRARLAASDELRSGGVPRAAIQGGWEYDGDTQLNRKGYINDWRLKIPAGAYRFNDPSLVLAPGCRFWFSKYTPVVEPRYFVVFSRQTCLATSPFPAIVYSAWLPPFQRKILIQQAPPNLPATATLAPVE